MHPIVLGELATGNLPKRQQTISDLKDLPMVSNVYFDEAFSLIEQGKLYGKGLHWNDIQLLASALVFDCKLYTRDKALHQAAMQMGCTY